jgi:hypothetical protein
MPLKKSQQSRNGVHLLVNHLKEKEGIFLMQLGSHFLREKKLQQTERKQKVTRKGNNLLNSLKTLLRKLLGLDKPEKDEHEDKKNWGI